jgi:hypothetical protein
MARIVINVGFCEHGNEHSEYLKKLGISVLAEGLPAFHETVCFIEVLVKSQQVS